MHPLVLLPFVFTFAFIYIPDFINSGRNSATMASGSARIGLYLDEYISMTNFPFSVSFFLNSMLISSLEKVKNAVSKLAIMMLLKLLKTQEAASGSRAKLNSAEKYSLRPISVSADPSTDTHEK